MTPPRTPAEREASRLLHEPLPDASSIVLECAICGHVRVVETGTTVQCRHGGEWQAMVIASDQATARERARTQTQAVEISVQEPML